jgi:hypothetical protein
MYFHLSITSSVSYPPAEPLHHVLIASVLAWVIARVVCKDVEAKQNIACVSADVGSCLAYNFTRSIVNHLKLCEKRRPVKIQLDDESEWLRGSIHTPAARGLIPCEG